MILVPPTPTPPDAASEATPKPAPTPAPTPEPLLSAADKPEDLVYNLNAYKDEVRLADAPNDQKGKEPSTDLLSALAVIDKEHMYVRLEFREEMPEDAPAEIRFWIEQEKPLVTVEVKLGSRGRPCELSAVEGNPQEQVVEGCYFVGNPIELSFPLDAIPDVVKVDQPFHVSGFQTCCMDEARNDPFDEVQGAQEVFRVDWAPPEEPAP